MYSSIQWYSNRPSPWSWTIQGVEIVREFLKRSYLPPVSFYHSHLPHNFLPFLIHLSIPQLSFFYLIFFSQQHHNGIYSLLSSLLAFPERNFSFVDKLQEQHSLHFEHWFFTCRHSISHWFLIFYLFRWSVLKENYHIKRPCCCCWC